MPDHDREAMMSDNPDRVGPERPKEEGGVWGSYVGYLQELEQEVARHRTINLLRVIERPDLMDYEDGLNDRAEIVMKGGPDHAV